jgi:hypothetical protein
VALPTRKLEELRRHVEVGSGRPRGELAKASRTTAVERLDVARAKKREAVAAS